MASTEALLFHVQPVIPLQGFTAGDIKEAAVKPAGDSIVVQVFAEDLFIFGKDSAACGRKIPLETASASLLPGSDLVLCIDVSADSDIVEVMKVLKQPQDQVPAAPEALLLQCASRDDAEALLANLQMAGCAMRGLLHRYDLLQKVGSGAFGQVMKAKDKLTGKTVAVKLFSRSTPIHLHPLRESTLLRRASHPAFVAFEGVYQVSEPELLSMLNYEGDSTWAIVTEFVDGIELFEFLGCRKMDEQSVRKMARKLFSGLCWLHERGIIHRDVKPENVMVTGDGDVRLLDFGIATPTWDNEAMIRASGSLGHVAPEVMRLKLPTGKSDCFSMGTLLFGAICGVKPFVGANMQELTQRNYKSKYSKRLLKDLSPDAIDLITALLEKKPDRRPSAWESLRHPWLQELVPFSPPLPQGPRRGKARPGSALVCRSKEMFNSQSTAATAADCDIDQLSEHLWQSCESTRTPRASGSSVLAVRSLRMPSSPKEVIPQQ
jgi:serine/threonine protein kinase